MESRASYPSKEEILENLQPVVKEDREFLERWKNEWYYGKWSKLEKQEKITALQDLARGLVPRKLALDFDVNYKTWYVAQNLNGREWRFGMGLTNPSIISCLHEVGHILRGHSELSACTYSVALFQKCFPKEYTKLTWEGHMLVKQHD